MRFLLDTNAVIAALNDAVGSVASRLKREAPADVGVSAVVMHELYFGAYKSARLDRNLAVVEGLRFEVLPLEREDARHAAEIRAGLGALGVPIGAYDLLIAGQARARSLTLVTRNVREFSRVPGLAVENWHDAPDR